MFGTVYKPCWVWTSDWLSWMETQTGDLVSVPNRKLPSLFKRAIQQSTYSNFCKSSQIATLPGRPYSMSSSYTGISFDIHVLLEVIQALETLLSFQYKNGSRNLCISPVLGSSQFNPKIKSRISTLGTVWPWTHPRTIRAGGVSIALTSHGVMSSEAGLPLTFHVPTNNLQT